MERPAPEVDADHLLSSALADRPDLFVRRAAVVEAEARLNLQRADRWGNPTVGPVYQTDQSRLRFTGIQIGAPIPIFNHNQGEIHQREAERIRRSCRCGRRKRKSAKMSLPPRPAFGRLVFG